MFDIGGVELIVIAAVAILVVGPRELPGMLRGIGKFARQLREMTSTVQRQFNDALKEAELDDVKKTIDDVRSLNPATKIRQTIAKEMKPLTDVGDSVKSAVGQVSTMAKPDTGPAGGGADKAAKTASGNAAPRAVESPPPGKKTAALAKKPAAKKNTAKSASKTALAAAKASAPVKTGAARATSGTATTKAATKRAAKTPPAAAKASAPVKTGAAKATAKSAPKSSAKRAAKATSAKARPPAKTGAARATAKTAPVTTGTGNDG